MARRSTPACANSVSAGGRQSAGRHVSREVYFVQDVLRAAGAARQARSARLAEVAGQRGDGRVCTWSTTAPAEPPSRRARRRRSGSGWRKWPSIRWCAARASCSTPGWCASTSREAATLGEPFADHDSRRLCACSKDSEILPILARMLKQAQQMGGRMQAARRRAQSASAPKGTAGGGLVDGRSQRAGRSAALPHRSVAVHRRRPRTDRRPAAGGRQSGHGQEPSELHAEAMKSLTEGVDMPGLNDMLSQLSGGEPEPG